MMCPYLLVDCLGQQAVIWLGVNSYVYVTPSYEALFSPVLDVSCWLD